MSWRQLGIGLGVLVVVIGLISLRAILSDNPGAEPSPSASALVSVVESPSATALISSAPSPTATLEPTPTASPTPIPTPVPTVKPTVKPTAAPPTPQPTVMCIPEPNGWQSTFQHTVVAGQTMQITHSYMPVGQKMHLEADYPNGQTVSIGDATSVVVGDHTEMTWIWTVPASMTPGPGIVRWTGGCGARSYDGYTDFTVTAP